MLTKRGRRVFQVVSLSASKHRNLFVILTMFSFKWYSFKYFKKGEKYSYFKNCIKHGEQFIKVQILIKHHLRGSIFKILWYKCYCIPIYDCLRSIYISWYCTWVIYISNLILVHLLYKSIFCLFLCLVFCHHQKGGDCCSPKWFWW